MGAVLKGGAIGTLVEIACGVGASAKYLAGSYRRYVGVDYSPELVKNARDFHAGTPNVEFIVRNVKDLSPSDIDNADCVLAVGALHHFTEIDVAMQRIRSIARKGAWFVAIEPQRGNPFIQGMRWVRTKIDSSYSDEQRFFSKNELEDLMKRHGFTDIAVEHKFYTSKPFGEVTWLTYPLSRLATATDQ